MLPVSPAAASSFSPQPSRFQAPLSPSAMQTSFKVDEGYSEETRSQTGSDVATQSPPRVGDLMAEASDVAIPGWIMTLNEPERSELAYMILRTLRTSSMSAIIERLHPLLHRNPIAFLPPELIFEIFSYLDSQTLLLASMISSGWRERALDSALWKQLYWYEGWSAELREVRRFEHDGHFSNTQVGNNSHLTRFTPGGISESRRSQSLAQEGLFGGSSHASRQSAHRPPNSEDPRRWKRQHDEIEVDDISSTVPGIEQTDAGQDAEMQDADIYAMGGASQSTMAVNDPMESTSVDGNETGLGSEKRSSNPQETFHTGVSVTASLTLPSQRGERKLNWQHLYKQRRRLEDNWSAGRFSNFQLPHPDYPEEGHSECVYTIQYYGKYLVSGSRDKSVRIWDLDTRRLVRNPLSGHTGSVLCLQFDASEDEDLVVSGSSDTDVIVWRFSTGAKIKVIRQAHKESVLNLKFDKRYLITCSKDKTVNVWNRKHLEATDEDFPTYAKNEGGSMFPTYVLNMAQYNFLVAEGTLMSATRPPTLAEYSLLMTLKGHNAAVNAIQVYGDQVVSASGDRTIKVWSLQTGLCDMTIPGHNKGIACVQYDGRRIVSGSSDNSVKIFDRSGGEVACLRGHENLVRTVQAGFGDLPGSELDDVSEARAVDKKYFEAQSSGQIGPDPGGRVRQARNAGSKDPRNITAFGAALPPGGGGSRWGRIVSGSYDETVIIWKRDSEGKWVIGHRLRQEDAARAAASQTTRPQPVNAMRASTQPQPSSAELLLALTQAQDSQAPSSQHAAPHNNAQPVSTLQQQILQHQQILHQQQLLQAAIANPALQMSINHHYQNNPNTPIPYHQIQAQLNAHFAAQAHAQQTQQTAPITQPPPPPPLIPQNNNNNTNNNTATTTATAAANNHHNHQHHHHHPHPPLAAGPAQPGLPAIGLGANQAHPGGGGGNSRVFKLQFDARRIICCSQDPKIVGWDFAKGDEEIIAASRFFQGLG
ncbi:MAG: hypothetical protein M1833_001011 [Piccolia ochrophora]|nr:MAG: hypothetical protein M1833_001011 [Piccolia ochrophora]